MEVLSAFGLVVGDMRFDSLRTSPEPSPRGETGLTGKGDIRPRSMPGWIGEVGNGETRPRWAGGIGSEITGTEAYAPVGFMTSDSEAERTACVGAETGGAGNFRVGGGPAGGGEGRGRDGAPRTSAPSADIDRGGTRCCAERGLFGAGGTSGSGPCGGGVGGGIP